MAHLRWEIKIQLYVSIQNDCFEFTNDVSNIILLFPNYVLFRILLDELILFPIEFVCFQSVNNFNRHVSKLPITQQKSKWPTIVFPSCMLYNKLLYKFAYFMHLKIFMTYHEIMLMFKKIWSRLCLNW